MKGKYNVHIPHKNSTKDDIRTLLNELKMLKLQEQNKKNYLDIPRASGISTCNKIGLIQDFHSSIREADFEVEEVNSQELESCNSEKIEYIILDTIHQVAPGD